ncbi:putative ATP-dependent RNA helicase DHR1 [Neophaeococcomyces mojaviensis]|uniref:ATP-dependent RNA helicase DHR1 n=1 Tax=Neophaeococcomyces mojaviensis TaxID=3383035 RepID=A0ACC3AK50_9EURO|nr:putative ATP-dependent RNA helicase DHR1 [Knufia sp. JES_112]
MPSKFAPTRQRKRKVVARQSQVQQPQDTNQVVITATKSEREDRRQQLRNELRAQQLTISAKKQKRLNKYVENKLKKEENLDLVKKLAVEKEKFDVRGLQSSKNLTSKKRTFTDYVDGQVRHEQQSEVTEHVQQNGREKPARRTQWDGDDVESEDSFEEEHEEAFMPTNEPTTDDAWTKSRAPPVQGTGLALPLQLGPDGMPIIPTRGKRRQKEELNGQETLRSEVDTQDKNWRHKTDQATEETPWEGFSSEDERADVPSEKPKNPRKIDDKVLDALLDALEDSDFGDEDDEDDENESQAIAGDGAELSSGEDEEVEASSEDAEGSADASESDAESDVSSETSIASSGKTELKPRVSAFKSWATQQLNKSIGHVPSYEEPQKDSSESADKLIGVKPAAGYRLGVQDLEKPRSVRSVYNVHVKRTEAIQQSRTELPILQREQEIMEAIHNHSVVVVKGETGSGKTTQLPQFLFEAGFGDKESSTPGMIGITQPRRVAAVSMAKRVAEELGNHGDRVAHQIRFDTTVSSKTAVKFMTDGILLRELSQDLLLKKYSVIVIDEAHERSVNTDLLIGMLSRVVPARMKKSEQNPDPKPLKLVIMSATLNIEDFLHEKLFSPSLRPPIVQVEGRQHKVTTHFALRSRADYIEEVIEKVKRGHRKLPRGGMLVFLTGQNEIKHVLSQLRKDLVRLSNSTHDTTMPRMHISATEVPLETDDIEIGNPEHIHVNGDEDEIDILTDEAEADKEFEISDYEEEQDFEPSTAVSSHDQSRDPYDTVHLLPLYSQLPTKEQLRVFEPPPDRARMIVLATNVAETSLTIPGIRYVFDCGRSKERKYDIESNVQTFEIDYVSKASAQQRTGRAGRTGPGHCWRLYSSAVYEQFFPDHTEPEILRTPAESVVLQLKGFRYPRPVIDFPFPSAPPKNMLQKAEKLLRNLGAISGPAGGITELGKKLSSYPLSPRLGKILFNAIAQPSILPEVLALAAALSVDDIFINETQIDMQVRGNEQGKIYTTADHIEDNERERKREQYGRAHALFSKHDKFSDVLKLVTAVQHYLEAPNRESFCQQHFLRPKAMFEISQLFSQLRSMIQANHPQISTKDVQLKSKLNSTSLKKISEVAASGYIDQIALRYDLHPTPPILPRRPTRPIDIPYLPLTPLNSHSSDLLDRAVFIHPSSVLSRLSSKSVPEYIVYRHLQTAQAHNVSANGDVKTKTRMMPLTTLEAQTLLSLVRDTGLIEYGKPVPKTKVEDVPNTRPKERICWVSAEIRDRDGSGAGIGGGWPLPPSRVRQVMDLKEPSGWRVVEVLA